MYRMTCACVLFLTALTTTGFSAAKTQSAKDTTKSGFQTAMVSKPAGIEKQLTIVGNRATGCCNDGCAIEGCDSSCAFQLPRVDTDPGCSTTYVGFEASLLKPHTGDIRIGGVGAVTPGYDYELAPRIFVGHENADGLGARLTYWQFDHPSENNAIAAAGLEAHSLDLDVTSRAAFAGWDLMTMAGVRYASLELSIGGGPLGLAATTDFDGFGPTLGLEARKCFSDSLTLVANGRAGLIFGNTEIGIAPLGSGEAHDHYLQTLEARMGVEYSASVGNGVMFTRAMLEAQTWESGSILGLISPDVGFVGPTLSIGFTR